MDERELLLLGLLKIQSQHGYQINEFITKNLSRVTTMKKATAYAQLENMRKKGLIDENISQEGNRPQRKVYSITPAGDAAFDTLLKTYLIQPGQITFTLDIALMFIGNLRVEEVIAMLDERIHLLLEQIDTYERAPKHGYELGSRLAVEHVLAHLRLDLAWLQSAKETIIQESSSGSGK